MGSTYIFEVLSRIFCHGRNRFWHLERNIFHIDGNDVINATLKYLFIDTYKATLSHCDYNRRPSIIGLYHSFKPYIDLNLSSRPAGIWTWNSKTQSGFANHWATLHWLQSLHFILLLYYLFYFLLVIFKFAVFVYINLIKEKKYFSCLRNGLF